MGGIAPPAPAPVQTYYVPWKILNSSAGIPGESLLVVYWFPLSSDSARTSELTSSRPLTMRAAQCVTMALVPPERTDLQARFEVVGKLPAVVIATIDGSVVGRVENVNDTLRLRDVEKALDKVIDDEEKALDAALKDAESSVAAGKKDSAIAAYRAIESAGCLHPKKAKAAAKALGKLGETVSFLDRPSPALDRALGDRIVRVMNEGLAAEEAEDYEKARASYEAAMALDPADPVPLRFLGELERHHLGRWEKATAHFQQILAMNADPLSRAVALHGLGKMTIHAGDSPGGFALFERSIAEYPLALTYRNMAVFWNSEGEREKAAGYTRQALALDPLDPYNLVFGAVYLAEEGKVDEAITIAEKNQGLMPASYNLAAIYAIAGERDKAMALLRRHFYDYERYDAVRAREMWEARVDIVFTSIKNDPEFRELTKLSR
jgi:tetratricopeptide (TPR) repeat protein